MGIYIRNENSLLLSKMCRMESSDHFLINQSNSTVNIYDIAFLYIRKSNSFSTLENYISTPLILTVLSESKTQSASQTSDIILPRWCISFSINRKMIAVNIISTEIKHRTPTFVRLSKLVLYRNLGKSTDYKQDQVSYIFMPNLTTFLPFMHNKMAWIPKFALFQNGTKLD